MPTGDLKQSAPSRGVSEERAPSTAEAQELVRLRRERDTLKEQLQSTAVKDVLPVRYETTNPADASRYGDAGGVLVSITKLYPGSMKSGKRYGFTNTKEELEEMVKRMNQEAVV